MEDTRIVRAPRQPEKQSLAQRMRRVMTPAEGILWKNLRSNRLGGLHFRRQQVIAGFIADFYCHAARLVIECDGSAHDGREEYDEDRDRILASHNLRVLRVTNERIQSDLPALLAEILTYVPTQI
jgi:very-short-patch-repair endonuclease